jgi:hypothetical protein
MSFRLFGVAVVVLAATLGCFRSSGGAKSASGNAYPTYTEGGTMTLTINGAPVTVPITDALFNNTDEGYPDNIEFSGPQTYIMAQVENKIHDGPDGLSDYKPILHKAQPILTDKTPQPMTVGVPNAGAYPVTGGSITLTKYDQGMEGRVMWEGNVMLHIQSSTGPAVVPGSFKIVVVPVW